jgi:hypothetical protein
VCVCVWERERERERDREADEAWAKLEDEFERGSNVAPRSVCAMSKTSLSNIKQRPVSALGLRPNRGILIPKATKPETVFP